MNKQNTQSRFAAGPLCAVVLSNCLLAVAPMSAANPPAQGPAAATANAQSVPVDGLSALLLAAVDTQVDAENTKLANDSSHRATIAASIQAHTPYMTTTTHPNRPNQFYADVPFTVTYQVTNIQAKILGHWFSYPFDRTITQEIDVQTTCEGWFTGSGALTYTVIPQPAYLQGDHSFVEDAIGAILLEIIPDYVDNQIRDALAGFATGSTTISNGTACRSLGVSTREQGFPFDSVNYDRPTAHPPVGTPIQDVVVRVTKVRRMDVRDSSGKQVYNALELPRLDFYVNNSHVSLRLPLMSPGQTVSVSQDNVLQTPAPSISGSLILIANMSSGNDDVNADYMFVTFGSGSNFGNGTHTLLTPKHWIQPVTQLGTKAVTATAPGYEITVEISAPTQQTTNR